MNNVGVYWIAIELTTLVSTFLVGFERGRGSDRGGVEIHHRGIGGYQPRAARDRALLLGGKSRYWPDLRYDVGHVAPCGPQMNPALTQMAFLLVLVGYGTKAGLAPMHTWLPDAHSEGPAPVSAMLSGAL